MRESVQRETTIRKCRETTQNLLKKLRERGGRLKELIESGNATESQKKHYYETLQHLKTLRSI